MSTVREHGMRRLRRATAVALTGAGALTLAIAGLAARALPGRHATTVRTRAATTTRHPTAPPLVPVQGAGEQQSSPSQPPAQSQAPPVAVSGGT